MKGLDQIPWSLIFLGSQILWKSDADYGSWSQKICMHWTHALTRFHLQLRHATEPWQSVLRTTRHMEAALGLSKALIIEDFGDPQMESEPSP